MEQQPDTKIEQKTSRTGIIDCDVHPYPRNAEEIRSYMKQHWRGRYNGGGRGFYGNPVHGDRLDARPPQGGPSGSDPELLRRQLIDEYGHAYALLMPRTFCNLHPIPISATQSRRHITTG